MVTVPERWWPIQGWPYYVSDLGRVRSNRSGLVLTPMRCGRKRRQYYAVRLCNKGKQKHAQVHLLVLETFVGPRPPGMNGLHRDDDPLNNNLGNLYWGTPQQNAIDRDRRLNTLSQSEIQAIRKRRAAGERGRNLAKEFGVSEQFICDIVKGRCHYYD